MQDTVKILVCEDHQSLMLSCHADRYAEWVFFELYEANMLQKIAEVQPDIVFLDLFMPKMDAIEMIEAYTALFGRTKPYFAVLCPFISAHLNEELKQCGAQRLLLRPYSLHDITDIIMQAHQHKMLQGVRTDDARAAMQELHRAYCSGDTEPIVAEFLREFRIYPGNAGFEYVKRAVMLAVDDESMMYSVTRVLYPTIAEEMGTTPSGVERKIRHAIAGAWHRCGSGVIQEYFGNTVDNLKGKPANSEFIAMLADRVRLNMRSARKLVMQKELAV